MGKESKGKEEEICVETKNSNKNNIRKKVIKWKVEKREMQRE